ncbi:MAG: A/G-specific adenine glycosylase [Salinisphaera sp.]|jgi:A/G-specific adenine glycosylase|nr:A/G-specific adenine glycosylase [Salinisphaera sp.]
MNDTPPEQIADALLAWFDRHGRRDLPWQHPRTAYRVWIAEIMLQQTQVTTVVDYFNRFMVRFPDVETLAEAVSDDVMRHWAGLGYYARARNLHAAAQRIVEAHAGELPGDVETLISLPGVGRSTAGAIVAQAFGRWAPILDGNAKRVIARLAAVTATPGTAAYEKPLWQLAERYTPQERVTDYTQAIMDLGATVCTRGRPHCERCPLADRCLAKQAAIQNQLPTRRQRKRREQRETTVLLIEDAQGRILLEKRPPAGIWGGLWSLPEVAADADVEALCTQRYGIRADAGLLLTPLSHTFTHFELTIHPRRMQHRDTVRIMDANHRWFTRDDRPGIPAPIARLLNTPQQSLAL